MGRTLRLPAQTEDVNAWGQAVMKDFTVQEATTSQLMKHRLLGLEKMTKRMLLTKDSVEL